MSEISVGAGDIFNARDLTASDVARRFIAPPQFVRLLGPKHCILEGPRGSGKTTMLRMLTPEAYALWRENNPAPPLDFIGVFVPADIRWSKQLTVRTDRIANPLGRDLLQQAAFSVAVGLALIDTIQRCGELHDKYGSEHPLLFFPVTRQAQGEIVVALSALWSLEVAVPSFNGLRLAMRIRQHQISDAATLLAEGSSIEFVRSQYKFITSTWLDSLITAVETVNDVLGRSDQMWGVLLDELEIVPPGLLQSVVDALRSTSNKVRFKLALSPTGADLVPRAEPSSPGALEDYLIIKLWYERKGEARSFASMLFAASLTRAFNLQAQEVDLEKLLGVSWASESDSEIIEDQEDESAITLSEPAPVHRQRVAAFASLYRKDESFRRFIDDKKIDPTSPPYTDETPEGILVRKITQVVLHRNRALDSYTYERGGRRKGGRQNLHPYCGLPNIVDLTEGNPRWVLTLAEALVAASKSSTDLARQSVQSIAIRDFCQQMRAKLTVYPTKAAALGRRWTPFQFVEALASSVQEAIFGRDFSPDPPMSFTVDQSALEQYGDYVRTAIDLGALVIMRQHKSPRSSEIGANQMLLGARVRLTYRLAPLFGLPLLYMKEQRMSSALSSGELLVTTERSRTNLKVLVNSPVMEQAEPVQGRLL